MGSAVERNYWKIEEAERRTRKSDPLLTVTNGCYTAG
jgi:hypothetical protein